MPPTPEKSESVRRCKSTHNRAPAHLDDQVVSQIVAILRPLKGAGEPYYEDADHPDRVGPDQPIREILGQVLEELDIDGMGGCRLCLS